MRIPSGKIDQLIYFVAEDTSGTRKTGLSSFTVYRSRNGGAATLYTTPTVAELSAGNMPGVYALTVDEDTTIASTSDSEEYCVHITATGMLAVTRTIELYRRDTTSGNTLAVDGSGSATVGTNNDKTNYRLSPTGVNDILRTALTEGYAANGATFTLEQVTYMIWSLLSERALSSTTLTANKLDGTTPAMTFTLDSATTPTSQIRVT